jgi:hypothetical protein
MSRVAGSEVAAPGPIRAGARVGGAVGAGLAVWALAAALVGASGVLGRLPRPAVQVILLGLTAAVLVAVRAAPALRAWAASEGLRTFVWLHVSRFVGLYFLYLYGRGELPYAFAVPAGVGDVAVACGAVALVSLPRAGERFRVLVLVWNVLGLADILFVVAAAARLGTADPASMRALTRLPLSLLPTFLVPLIIASHVLIFLRLRRR